MKVVARTHKSKILDKFFNMSPAKEIRYSQTEAKMVLAAKINDVMQAKGISRHQLAVMLMRNPSTITKWLRGNHNFTTDTLVELEHALGIKLIDTTMFSTE